MGDLPRNHPVVSQGNASEIRYRYSIIELESPYPAAQSAVRDWICATYVATQVCMALVEIDSSDLCYFGGKVVSPKRRSFGIPSVLLHRLFDPQIDALSGVGDRVPRPPSPATIGSVRRFADTLLASGIRTGNPSPPWKSERWALSTTGRSGIAIPYRRCPISISRLAISTRPNG